MSTMMEVATTARGIDAIFYLTKDLSRARLFYESVFGLHARIDFDPHGCEFDLDDGTVFGLAHQTDFWMQSGGILFAVDDIEEHLDRVRAHGGSILKLPVTTHMCRIAWCADSEGNTFALHNRDHDADAHC